MSVSPGQSLVIQDKISQNRTQAVPEPPSCVTNVWEKMTRDEDTDSCGFRTQGNL